MADKSIKDKNQNNKIYSFNQGGQRKMKRRKNRWHKQKTKGKMS